MKIFGFSVLGIAIILVGVGVFFTLIKPKQVETEIPQREDIVLGTQSRLHFSGSTVQ